MIVETIKADQKIIIQRLIPIKRIKLRDAQIIRGLRVKPAMAILLLLFIND